MLLAALVIFVFHNGGWRDIEPLAIALISIWVVVALAYVALRPEPYPLFFGVPSWRAAWVTRPHLYKMFLPAAAAGAILWWIVK